MIEVDRLGGDLEESLEVASRDDLVREPLREHSEVQMEKQA